MGRVLARQFVSPLNLCVFAKFTARAGIAIILMKAARNLHVNLRSRPRWAK